MTTEYLKFPRTYKDLNFDNAPYIHAVWRLTKWKWGEGVQLPFNAYYFPQDPGDPNWDLFGNCDEIDMVMRIIMMKKRETERERERERDV